MPKWWAISCTTVTATSCAELVAVLAHPAQGTAEEDDPVGQGTCCPPVAALGERGALVDPQQVRVVRRGLVLDEEDDVVEQPHELGRDVVQRLADEVLELLSTDSHHGASLP